MPSIFVPQASGAQLERTSRSGLIELKTSLAFLEHRLAANPLGGTWLKPELWLDATAPFPIRISCIVFPAHRVQR
jgi:hypothetical protein